MMDMRLDASGVSAKGRRLWELSCLIGGSYDNIYGHFLTIYIPVL